MPGMRPPMGGAPHLVSAPPGAGGMGILMPIYTIGIVIFFVYTMMKVSRIIFLLIFETISKNIIETTNR